MQNPNYSDSSVPIAISVNLSGAGTINKISNNKISNIINTWYFSVTGISYNTTNTAATNIFNNRIDNVYNLYSSTTSPAPNPNSNNLTGIIEGGGGNDSIYNNTINMGAISYQTTKIYGIKKTGSGMHIYCYNTVNIIGSTLSAYVYAGMSAAFSGANAILRNNIFNNKRLGSFYTPPSFKSFAIIGGTTINSDYNLLFTADSIVALSGTTYYTFNSWKATGKDINSVNAPVTFVSATDLHIDGTNANAWNVYGRGIAIPTISTDIDGDSRSTIIGTHVTIGADEIPTPTSTSLVIDLKTVTAKNLGNKNRIDWSTAKENRTDYFELESSIDARNFKKIARLNAKGQASAYTYWDEKAALGMNYYRLKMTTEDGSFAYSKTVSAEVKPLSGFTITAYPNPVQNKIVLKIDGTIQANAIIALIDISGKTLQTLNVTSHEIEMDMNHFATGTYFIKYTDVQQEQSIKITKQ